MFQTITNSPPTIARTANATNISVGRRIPPSPYGSGSGDGGQPRENTGGAVRAAYALLRRHVHEPISHESAIPNIRPATPPTTTSFSMHRAPVAGGIVRRRDHAEVRAREVVGREIRVRGLERGRRRTCASCSAALAPSAGRLVRAGVRAASYAACAVACGSVRAEASVRPFGIRLKTCEGLGDGSLVCRT